jgi:threonyl-tRNA synthetase
MRLALRRSCLDQVARRGNTRQNFQISNATLSTTDARQGPALQIELPTNESAPQLLALRHTASHVLAMAVQRLFPQAQVTIGPWTENGFFYDFFRPDEQFTEADLTTVQAEMVRIVKADLPMKCEEVSREEARARIEAIGESYKLEILDEITTEPITIWHTGDEWWDLCAWPHVSSTGKIPRNAFVLESVAGAYWRGDANRPMLQRIYGTAWENKEQLSGYKKRQAEAKLRDHRLLGQRLDLFSLQEQAGGGLVFWHPKGAIVRAQIEALWKNKHTDAGYEHVHSPHVANADLWKMSGHYDFYQESMFSQMNVDGGAYQLRPMNCPMHCLMYASRPRSYRDLPIRWAELGTVYRYEKQSTLHGLMRVRGFTQDDAHIFCLPDQLQAEIVGVLDLFESILKCFGFAK